MTISVCDIQECTIACREIFLKTIYGYFVVVGLTLFTDNFIKIPQL